MEEKNIPYKIKFWLYLFKREKYLDLNGRDNEGRTPFHYLCANWKLSLNFDTLLYLVEGGADMTIKDNEGKTPLEYLPSDFKKQIWEKYENFLNNEKKQKIIK